MNKIVAVIFFSLISSMTLSAQDNVAIKTNLLYGSLAMTPNLGVEVGVSNHFTINLFGSYNWFNLNGTSNANKKRVHWIVQPELRYFLNERFSGHFFGVHGIGSMYNIGGYENRLLLGMTTPNYRFEGYAAGAGFTYGYQLPIARRWNLGFSVGLGYVYTEFDKYDQSKCGTKVGGTYSKHYFGPTNANVSIMFLL